MRKYILIILLSIIGFVASAETAILTPNQRDNVVHKNGTVTFLNNGVTLEEVAKRYQLKHISGTRYKAAIIYSCSFDKNGGRGKIYNCTDNAIRVQCKFYSGNSLIQTSNVDVAARTFSRIYIPSGCDKIILVD